MPRIDLPLCTSIGNEAFRRCILETLILRSNTVCTLVNVLALAGTRIETGTGYVYVPAALVNAYKTATNWVTYADQIRAIEDYPGVTG